MKAVRTGMGGRVQRGEDSAGSAAVGRRMILGVQGRDVWHKREDPT